ncbi:uncharacterized protein EI97DRAFT_435018 [Westerdykella ornata]|uniref:Protein-S-isoprenylcysteine O-methyltransferase n=1 Tax=Westerdykella ornata TaxID=318751 RepID=A0A6A6JD35_WESOR|nr:uncharacterized protein EI97DRAFT_435018 [Westerdykella ornata]KAF2274471.1 hypothetical protein EI97DRAFT_435018 [Westerdykella ornata]
MLHVSSLPNTATLSLSASFLLAAYLTDHCWTPPNSNPTGPASSLPKDTIAPVTAPLNILRFLTSALWLVQTLIAFSYPSPPRAICPTPGNLNGQLFTWSPYTATVLVIISISAPIRLLAYKDLGENFTFRLARPKRLITTGLYAYVQHPSYPTLWLILAANLGLLLRLDGVVGCILPTEVVTLGMGRGILGIWHAGLVGFMGVGLYATWLRVRDEEVMMKEEFGKEWEEYHARTKRFVPGIF